MKILLTAPPKYLFLRDTEEICTRVTKKEMMIHPLAIYQLASVLQEKEHSVQIVDPALSEVRCGGMDTIKIPDYELIHSLQFPTIENQMNSVDVIGISVNSLNWFLAKVMVERFKSTDQDLPIVAGGPHATFADEHILKSTKLDYAVRKEGEKSLPELLTTIENNGDMKEVLGISYKKDGYIVRNDDRPPLTLKEMEETPFPAFDLMPDNLYEQIGVEASRGCKFACTFCSIPFKKFWRGINPEIVQRRMEHALDYTKMLCGKEKAICLVDDTFTEDKKRAEQIVDNLSELDFGNVRFILEGRVNDLSDTNILKRCKKIPLNFILVGVESGYNECFKKIKKGITTQIKEKCAAIAKQQGIRLVHDTIIGFPWESKADCLKTIGFLYKLLSNYGGIAFINWFRLLPGSEIWNNRLLYGLKGDLDLYDSLVFGTEEVRLKISSKLSESDLIAIDERIELISFMLAVKGNDSYIQKASPYYDAIKIFKFENS